MTSIRFITLAAIVSLLATVNAGALPVAPSSSSMSSAAHPTHSATATSAHPMHTAAAHHANTTSTHGGDAKTNGTHPHMMQPYKQSAPLGTTSSSTTSSTKAPAATPYRHVRPMPVEDAHRDSSSHHHEHDRSHDNTHYYTKQSHTPAASPAARPPLQNGPIAIEWVTTTVEDAQATDAPQVRSQEGKSPHRKHAHARPTGAYYYRTGSGIGVSLVLGSAENDVAPLTFIRGRGRPGIQALKRKDDAKQAAKAALAARQATDDDAPNDLPESNDPNGLPYGSDPTSWDPSSFDPTSVDPTNPDTTDPYTSPHTPPTPPSTTTVTDTTDNTDTDPNDATSAAPASPPSDPNSAIDPSSVPPAPASFMALPHPDYNSELRYEPFECFCDPGCNPDIETAVASGQCVSGQVANSPQYSGMPRYALPQMAPRPAAQPVDYPGYAQDAPSQ